jgi:ribosomal protein S1
MFNEWCGETDEWKKMAETSYVGKVTGIINSSKKCGVFVEIPSLMITGMITMKPEDIVRYKPQDEVNVKIVGFDEEKFYNPITKQMQHVDPYVVEDGTLKKCNIKPVLTLA